MQEMLYCKYVRVLKTQNEWKAEEISANNMGKVLHKLFKAVVNEP